MDVRVRFAVDDPALSDLHSRAFGYAATSVESWTQRLQRHSLTWIGAFDRGSLVGFVHACWDGGSHAFALDTSTPTTSDGASAAPSCRPLNGGSVSRRSPPSAVPILPRAAEAQRRYRARPLPRTGYPGFPGTEPAASPP